MKDKRVLGMILLMLMLMLFYMVSVAISEQEAAQTAGSAPTAAVEKRMDKQRPFVYSRNAENPGGRPAEMTKEETP